MGLVTCRGEYSRRPPLRFIGLIWVNRVSQTRSTCWGMSRSSATSLMVRNASGALSKCLLLWIAVEAIVYSDLSPPLAGLWPLIRCFRMADGLNTITRRGDIGTSVPVFGLRPIRWPFLRTMNDPHDDNFTVSPFSRQAVLSFNTSSTKAEASVRDKPTFW